MTDYKCQPGGCEPDEFGRVPEECDCYPVIDDATLARVGDRVGYLLPYLRGY